MVFKFGNTQVALLAAGLLAALLGAPGAAAWTWPVDGPVLRPFVADDDPYTGGQHRGIDIGAPSGTDVLAPASGVVSFAGQVPRQGLCLTIRTADGYSVTLVHLGSIGAAPRTTLAEGEVVGTIGPSGDPEGPEPYVHLGIRLTADPNGYLDPLTLLPARPAAPEPPVLKPGRPVARLRPTRTVAQSSVPRARSGSTRSASPQRRPVEVPRAKVPRRVVSPRTAVPARTLLVDATVPASRGDERRPEPRTAPARQRTSVHPPQPVARRTTPRGHRRVAAWLLGAAFAALLAASILAFRRPFRPTVAQRAAPIIDRDALLPDDTDLLHQLDPAHRSCVHDHRGGRPRAPSPSTRRRHVLPHRHRRARLEGRPGRRGAGPRAQGVRRSDRRALEGAA